MSDTCPVSLDIFLLRLFEARFFDSFCKSTVNCFFLYCFSVLNHVRRKCTIHFIDEPLLVFVSLDLRVVREKVKNDIRHKTVMLLSLSAPPSQLTYFPYYVFWLPYHHSHRDGKPYINKFPAQVLFFLIRSHKGY